MTIQSRIKSDPYLNPNNCTDITDIEYAIDELHKLDAKYGADNKTLMTLWSKFLDKKNKLTK